MYVLPINVYIVLDLKENMHAYGLTYSAHNERFSLWQLIFGGGAKTYHTLHQGTEFVICVPLGQLLSHVSLEKKLISSRYCFLICKTGLMIPISKVILKINVIIYFKLSCKYKVLFKC